MIDGLCPNQYFSACKYVNNTQLWIYTEISIQFFNLKISVFYCPGKPVEALRSLAHKKGFLLASATKAASWAGLVTCHKPVPLRLQTCPSLRYFCSHSLAVDFGTPYSWPVELAVNPPSSTRVMMCSQTDLSWRRNSLNFKPTLLIRRLKDNPNVDIPPSLPHSYLVSLGDWSLSERGRVRWVCF
jgi:hypothetical protein